MDRLPPTPRQLQVLELCARGMARDEIAGELFLSEATVTTHLDHLRGRLGARDVCHALAICVAEGFLAVDGRKQRLYVPAPLVEPELVAA